MRKSPIEWVHLGGLYLPRDLAEDVKTLLHDPRTGRTQYGELRKLVVMLFSNWLDEQRLPPPQPPEPL